MHVVYISTKYEMYDSISFPNNFLPSFHCPLYDAMCVASPFQDKKVLVAFIVYFLRTSFQEMYITTRSR